MSHDGVLWGRFLAGPSIPSLFGQGCPSAITRFVISIHVYAINRHTLRAFAHISKEILKDLPSLAVGNSPSSVVLVGFFIGIGTPLFQGVPRLIRPGPFLEGMPMSARNARPRNGSCGANLSLPTPTRGCISTTEMYSPRGNSLTAITLTNPSSIAMVITFGSFYYKQSTMFVADFGNYVVWHR